MIMPRIRNELKWHVRKSVQLLQYAIRLHTCVKTNTRVIIYEMCLSCTDCIAKRPALSVETTVIGRNKMSEIRFCLLSNGFSSSTVPQFGRFQ